MVRKALPLLLFVSFLGLLHARLSHLLVKSVGDGAIHFTEKGESNPLANARFIPFESEVTVLPDGGIETILPGFCFRFGSETTFTCRTSSLYLKEGALFGHSRKIDNSFLLETPTVQVRISGSGAFLVNLESDGSLKSVGILGKILFSSIDGSSSGRILPGELMMMNKSNGFFSIGEVSLIDLRTLIDSSFLLSGFSNNSILQRSLDQVCSAQEAFLDQPIVESEVALPDGGEASAAHRLASSPLGGESGGGAAAENQEFSSDPLGELLGRSPVRSSGVKLLEEESPAEAEVPPSDLEPQLPTVDLPSNPFPSKIFRAN